MDRHKVVTPAPRTNIVCTYIQHNVIEKVMTPVRFDTV